MSAALNITGLSFSYQSGEQPFRLDLPSLSLASGEQCLLTAASGRGKSTLLALIAGLIDPHRGTIEVAGTNIHSLHGHKRDLFRGRHIGMIFQTFNLLQGFTALENVKAALMLAGHSPRVQQEKAKALLDRLGIARQGALVETLSVGQQQRVAVARAMAVDPVLVLADEPTASLDPENAVAAMDLIQGLCREKNAALLCVSHDPSMASRFARREALNVGEAAASGAPAGGAGR
ncbi:MAG TPA: ABC transporter ATP-binding protein [Phycisphaerales bacterium]|nr:ABC transporter ATP-binding protein [Phycisphaerales bacterium]